MILQFIKRCRSHLSPPIGGIREPIILPLSSGTPNSGKVHVRYVCPRLGKRKDNFFVQIQGKKGPFLYITQGEEVGRFFLA